MAAKKGNATVMFVLISRYFYTLLIITLNNHFLTHTRYFYQNFIYTVVKAVVENNADISKNIFENYVTQRELIVPRQNFIIALWGTIPQMYFIPSVVAKVLVLSSFLWLTLTGEMSFHRQHTFIVHLIEILFQLQFYFILIYTPNKI